MLARPVGLKDHVCSILGVTLYSTQNLRTDVTLYSRLEAIAIRFTSGLRTLVERIARGVRSAPAGATRKWRTEAEGTRKKRGHDMRVCGKPLSEKSRGQSRDSLASSI